MIDYDILQESGLTQTRLQEIFTALLPGGHGTAVLPVNTSGEESDLEKDCKVRILLEQQIANRINEGVNESLRFANL